MERETPTSMLDRSGQILEDIFQGDPPFPTFSKDLSNVFSGGLLPGKLYTIEGPPDGTKSAFAILMANKMAEVHNIPCAFVSSTLTAEEVYIRSIARISRLHSGDIEGKAWLRDEWIAEHGRDAATGLKSRIKEADETFRRFAGNILMVEVPHEGGLSISEFEKMLQEQREYFQEKRGLSALPRIAVFIDTLRGLRYSKTTDKPAEPTASELILMLKELGVIARKTGCPIVALADGVAFGRLYLKAGILPSSHGRELGFTAYYADTTILLETDDTLLADAIEELYNRGQDTDAGKLEEARSRFPLSNPRIAPLVPTYARLTISTRGAGAVKNIYFIFLKALGDFLDLSFKKERKR
ncbi:hypothetical protein J7M28_14305 [bacterium]|nr:hypothetical protein [bacterium]